jgi:queuine tRNA-ribosyltransferase
MNPYGKNNIDMALADQGRIPTFRIEHTNGLCRSGALLTSQSEVPTPAFMPVATQATVKGISPQALWESGTRLCICNTYHLMQRPGAKVIQAAGGLSRFMGWEGATATDSGGFQAFSLGPLCKVTQQGFIFQSHIDGKRWELTPQLAMELQEQLGADLIMALDLPLPYPADEALAINAIHQTTLWAEECLDHHKKSEQMLLGIVQGGFSEELRLQSAKELVSLGFEGYAIGGLSVGEPKTLMWQLLAASLSELPDDKLRYMMGVGSPEDILTAIEMGVDLFDCVLPTRNARNGQIFTHRGRLNIKNGSYATDFNPPDPECSCPVCQQHTRAYLRHLLWANEMLGAQLATLHNLYFYQELMAKARKAIEQANFQSFKSQWLTMLNVNNDFSAS